MVPSRERGRASLLLAPLLALSLVLAGCGSDAPAATGGLTSEAALAGVVRAPALEVADVSLPDVSRDGAPTPMQAPPGEVLVVYFGYTSCPDVCPMTMSDLRAALDALPGGLAERVTVAMVTVDPERDEPEVLERYLGHFFDRTLPLRTDDADALAAAARAFSVQYEVEDHAPGDRTYEVAHSAITYVVDETGTVVVEWPFGFESQHMSADLTTLLTPQETP